MAFLPRPRVRARIPIDEAWGEVWEGRIACWSCGRETRFLSSIQVAVGAYEERFSLAELGAFEGLFETICDPLLPFVLACRIARRPSQARGRCRRRTWIGERVPFGAS